MKRSLLVICILVFHIMLLFNFTNAQSFYGNEWFVGIPLKSLSFDNGLNTSFLGNFDSTKYISKSNSNICDSNGHLLIATDGIKVYGKDGQYIDGGGENINNDSLTWDYGFDSAYPNTSIIIPKGGNQYYIFITTMSDSKWDKFTNHWNNDTFDFDEVRYSIVDMNENNGKGKIILKNKLLLHTDEYPWVNKSNFTACRHANGRDWWLLKPSARMRQKLYKFLVTPDTIITYEEQRPEYFSTWAYDNRGQSAFTKDGTQYAECNNNGPHFIYDFDRCSGELTFKRQINLLPYSDTFGTAIDGGNYPTWSGLCFSPNGRFLYTCNFWNVYQIDLWEPNDSLAIRRVSKDTSYWPVPNFGHQNYHAMQLTPTGVIYLGNRHGVTPNINGILYPDKLGDSCGFQFNYCTSIYNTNDPPNIPFYELGALANSPCDTIHPPPVESIESIILPNAISPNGDGINDTWHILNVAYLQQKGITLQNVAVFNRWGNEVFKSNDINFSWNPSSNLASDTYFYYLRYRTQQGTMQLMKGSLNVLR